MDSSDFVGMSDASPSELSDSIKQLLYDKSSRMVNDIRPIVASQLFDPTLEDDEE
jgi:hypothetical protein